MVDELKAIDSLRNLIWDMNQNESISFERVRDVCIAAERALSARPSTPNTIPMREVVAYHVKECRKLGEPEDDDSYASFQCGEQEAHRSSANYTARGPKLRFVGNSVRVIFREDTESRTSSSRREQYISAPCNPL